MSGKRQKLLRSKARQLASSYQKQVVQHFRELDRRQKRWRLFWDVLHMLLGAMAVGAGLIFGLYFIGR